jgi:predicted acetyltransferase
MRLAWNASRRIYFSCEPAAVELVTPTAEHLPSYESALESGWSADNVRGKVAAGEELTRLRSDPVAFVASMVDREAKRGPVTLADGSQVPRIPGYQRWLWDGEFCGSIGFRWQPGTTTPPPYCLGHVGYAVVPWKQRRGYATAALRMLLPAIEAEGLPFIEITTDPENIPSQRVILANGGLLIERFTKPVQYGSKPALRFRIAFAKASAS